MKTEQFIKVAKKIVTERELIDYDGVTDLEIFVVWYCKNLQNHKALLGSTSSNNYYEITFNGDKKEIYVDSYSKAKNEKIEKWKDKW